MRKATIVILGLLAASTATAQTAPAANRVVSDRAPELTLEVDDSFASLPPLKFPIENLTNAERRIFVDAGADRVVDRMVIVQFETVQPGSDFRLVFPSTPPRRFGAQTYRFGAFGYDDSAAAKRAPLKEPGRTRDFLAAHNYVPADRYRTARLARVSDPAGLSEVIIFYLENADRGPPPAEVDEDGDWALGPDEAEALTRRMESAVRVLKG